MDELFASLMGWAVSLSGYATPATLPDIAAVPHATLEAAACAGRHCKVLGWFPPGQRIYIDDRLDPRQSLYASSIVVHEMVHYLQQQSGRYAAPYTCDQAMAMEREAYAAQQEYLVRYGVYEPVGISMHNAGCVLTAEQH
ncbi:MAG TPA: hypothetical protein VMU33_13645 [Burkholderiaceae bacterium]|nr:hypothetical protein [Burkholderiaceae bacterium]